MREPIYKVESAGFTATAAAEILGVTQRAVIDWGGRGLVEPEVRITRGRGRGMAQYSSTNLVQMAVVRELLTRGMLRDDVVRLFEEKKPDATFSPESIPQSGVEWLLLIDGHEWTVCYTSDGQLHTAPAILGLGTERERKKISQAQWILALNLTEIKRSVKQRMPS